MSGLLAIRSVSGSGYVIVSSSGGNYIISVSGLQQSGNYSLVGHNHTTADITNFNTGVSGLLPVTNILGSGNTSVVQNGTSNIISPGTSTYNNTVLSCYGTSSQNAIIAVQFSNNGTTFYTTQYQYTLTAGNFGFSIPCSAYHIRLILLSAVTSTITAYIDIC